jgi:ATP adenylyltransferase
VEYYGKRTKQMVGKVLTKNGVVEPIRSGRAKGYRLNSEALTEAQRASLIAKCDKSISDYLDKRGDRIWQHRASESGYVSGSTRYNVLKRAKYRCELCGAHETQVALHVDHIIP